MKKHRFFTLLAVVLLTLGLTMGALAAAGPNEPETYTEGAVVTLPAGVEAVASR